MAAKRKRGGVRSSLNVRSSNIRVSLAGPTDRESSLRSQLEYQIYRRLVDRDYGCPKYFHDSGLAAKFARDLAQKVPFQAWKNPKKKTSVVSIKSMDIIYRNPPGGWKWWVSVRDDDEHRVKAGDPV